MFNSVKQALTSKTAKVGLGSSMLLALGSANAALPKDVTDALSAAKVDGVTVAGIVLTIIIAIAAFKYVRRAL